MAVSYDVVTRNRAGRERVRRYTSDSAPAPGDVLFLDDRWWLVVHIDGTRVEARPARYRIRLRHPDGREELGAFRRFRRDAPRLGHSFTTVEDGAPISWSVVDERPVDDDGDAYLELVAERDYSEFEELPDHELEHALARRAEELPDAAQALFARAEEQGLSLELVALEPGEAPDWEEAGRYVDALILEQIEDDLLETCGVNANRDPRETWLGKVKERLRQDLERFRADIEGDHDDIDEWELRGGRIFASVGSWEDEADPDSGHGWMCRLVDASALGAAGFERVSKARL